MQDLHQIGGPQAPCARTSCATAPAHLGGAHLDPTSDLYDGPDTKLHALPAGCRNAAFPVLHASRAEDWHTVEVRTALHVLAEEILRLRQQIAVVSVDRDRGIRDAMARAEDCAVHGATIRSEGHRAHYFSVVADRNDEERIAWLTAAHGIREAFVGRDDPVAKKVVAYVDAAARDAARIRKRYQPPTFADCQRAGSCEHPPTKPHEACEQLRFDVSRVGGS